MGKIFTTRRKLRASKWPDPYIFDCRILDRKTQKEKSVPLAMHLIHEILKVIWDLGLAEELLKEDGLDTTGKRHMAWMREHLHVEQLMGFGIHGDGVPCNYDRSEAVANLSKQKKTCTHTTHTHETCTKTKNKHGYY